MKGDLFVSDLIKKGWFLSDGSNYGCDYALYPSSQCFSHSKYLFLIKESYSVQDVLLQVRISEKTKKETLISNLIEGNVFYLAVTRWFP